MQELVTFVRDHITDEGALVWLSGGVILTEHALPSMVLA